MSSKETYQCEKCKAWQHQWKINCDSCNHDNRKYLETKFESIINKPRTISFVRSCPCCSFKLHKKEIDAKHSFEKFKIELNKFLIQIEENVITYL